MATTTNETPSVMEQHPVYKGSCHCQFVTYTVRLNLTSPNEQTGAILTKCNCSICVKTGALLTIPEKDTLKILTPAEGNDVLIDYTFGESTIHHRVCPKCGIKCFLGGNLTINGTTIYLERVNVLTLDGREDGKEMVDLKNIKVKYYAGRDDEWSRGLSDEPYEFGTW